jgi:hypothetical protein
VITEKLPAPTLNEPEEEPEDDEEGYESDLIKIGIFLANALMLGSFIVSLTFLGVAKNLGGAPMIASFILAIPVTLINAKYFFAPRDGDDEDTEGDDGKVDRGPVAPYVILVVMIVVITLVYGLMSLKQSL